MRKFIVAVLCAAMLTVTAFAYIPESFTEVDDSADVFSYTDDISGASAQTLTALGERIDRTKWRMRNADESPDGITGHEGNSPSPAKFGINANGDLFIDAVFNSVQSYNTAVAKTIPALVLTEDISALDGNHQISYEVQKNHNQTVTTGVRFMVHNGGKNYYALILGGNNYNEGNASSAWQLVKSVNGEVRPALLVGGTSDPGYLAMRNSVGNFWTVHITVVDGTISFTVTQTDNRSNTFGGTYTDEDPFTVSGSDLGVWLMAMNGNNNAARNAAYRNFSIKSYMPYLTAGEPGNVMYIDAAAGKTADSEGIISLSDAVVVRKITAPSMAYRLTNIYLSKDKTNWDSISTANFDENGSWLNNKSIGEYSYIAFDPDMTESVSVLTETTAEKVFALPLRSTLQLYPKAGEVTDPSAFVWESSRPDVATVENGVASLLRKGDVTVTATLEDVSFTANISVIGELEFAIKNGTVPEYIASVKPVFDEINKGIEEEDTDALKAVFLNTGDVKISDIGDIDAVKVAELSEEELDAFIVRIMTYESFPCEDADDVYFLADTIDKEYAVGILNALTEPEDIMAALEEQNAYLGLDLENKYYKKYTEDTAEMFGEMTFENSGDLQKKFEQAYVLTALDHALSPDMVKTLAEDCEAEIGYDKEHYEDVAGTALYRGIIENKSDFTDLKKLADFIDEYTLPEEEEEDDGRGSSGGSGGGGGGGGGRTPVSIKVDSGTVAAMETVVLPQAPVVFSDMDAAHWAYESVMTLKNKNIINGYEDGSFRPEGVVTRAEFIKMAVLALGLEPTDGEAVFSDVSESDWYYEAVTIGAQSGIITGYPDGTFRPDAIVTREEMAVMLHRAYTKYAPEKLMGGEEVTFADAADISDWAAEAVAALSRAGVLSGGADGSFEPARGAARGETAKCIAALL